MRKGRGEIKKIGELFEKYQRSLIAPQKTVIKTFIEVVYEVLEFEVAYDSVSYTPHTKTLSLRSKGPLKSEVMLHKDEILTHMKGRLGPKNAPTTIL